MFAYWGIDHFDSCYMSMNKFISISSLLMKLGVITFSIWLAPNSSKLGALSLAPLPKYDTFEQLLTSRVYVLL